MNSFTKGLLTGVFVIVVGLVISGSNYQDGQLFGLGTYQISTTTGDDSGTIRIFWNYYWYT